MSVRITFDIFSGLPNPQVVLDDAAAETFLNGVAFDRSKGTQVATDEPPRLGYRGLIVEQLSAFRTDLASRFRISGASVESAGKSYRLDSQDAEASLLDNATLLRGASISNELAAFLKSEAAANRAATKIASAPSDSPGPVKLLKCACAPIYEPNWWSDAATGGARQYHNNCYNYACNYRTDTYAQPGRAGGTHISGITCSGVKPALSSDALASYAPHPTTGLKCPDRGNLVAIVIWPNWDFHCYRLGNDGFWTHKPGSNPVTNLDNSGHVITDPRTADRGRYTDFCSFMVVMHGHIKLR